MDEVLEKLVAIRWLYANDDLTARDELKQRIAARARSSAALQTYSEVVDGVVFHLPNVAGGNPYEIDTSEWTSLDRAIIGDFLGRIDLDSYQAGKFFASALVVEASMRQPSRPFFKLATDVSFLPSNTEDTRLRFWSEQVRLAADWFAAHPQGQW